MACRGPESPNFAFLSSHDPSLLITAARAERYVFDDPNAALVKLRQLAEIFARGVAAHLGISFDPDDTFVDVERALRDIGQLDDRLHQVMRIVRRSGNVAAHSLDGERREALHSLKLVRQLAIWFHKAVKRDLNFNAGPLPQQAEDSVKPKTHRAICKFRPAGGG